MEGQSICFPYLLFELRNILRKGRTSTGRGRILLLDLALRSRLNGYIVMIAMLQELQDCRNIDEFEQSEELGSLE